MGGFFRHARGARDAEGGDAGAGLHQKAVGVTVIATFELDDVLAIREGTGHANR